MTVHVELNPATNRIELRCDYFAGVNDLCKSVQGYKWNPEEKIWTYPARMQVCHRIREVFGDLDIGPVLKKWARKNSRAYARQRSLASKPDSALEVVRSSHPFLWEAMSSRPYQRSGAEFLSVTRHTADFSEPGLGKTATALASLIQAGNWNGRHLVVVSNKTAIRSTWAAEIQKWTPDAKVYPMPEGWVRREKVLDKFWEDDEGPRFLVMLPHMLMIKQGHWCGKCEVWKEDAEKKNAEVTISPDHYGDNHKWKLADMKCDWPELFEDSWDSIIADEAHDYLLKVRDPRSKNQPQWAIGMRRLAVRHGGTKLAITGTPLRGKEEKIFGILHWLDPVRFSSYWAFVETYFEIIEDQYQQAGAPRGVTGSQKRAGRLRPEMEKAFYDILDSLCLRRTKREVRKELPPLVPQEHWVELDGEHRRQYEEFLKMGLVALENGVLEGMGRLSELTRLKQLAFGPWDVKYNQIEADGEEIGLAKMEMSPLVGQSPKVQLMMDMLSERGAFEPVGEQPEDAPKYIIASQYTQIVKGIREMLTAMKVPSLEITGEITGIRRDMAVKSFQEPGGPKILLLNTKAGGASLTLDRYCDDMFVMDETWIHDDQVQLMGRIDNRSGEIRPRFIHYFRTQETIDERIALGNDDQNVMQSKILDSRRGDDFALRLIRRSA